MQYPAGPMKYLRTRASLPFQELEEGVLLMMTWISSSESSVWHPSHWQGTHTLVYRGTTQDRL